MLASIKDAHKTILKARKTLFLLTFPWWHLFRTHNTKEKSRKRLFLFVLFTILFSLFTFL